MRWVFFTLVALNFGYFAWNFVWNNQSSQAAVSRALSSSEVANIQLLREALDVAEPLAESFGEAGPGAESVTAEEDPAEAAAVEPEIAAGGKKRDSIGVCRAYGPFLERRSGDGFVRYLQGADIEAWVLREQAESVSQVWGYIPPFPSLEEAILGIGKLGALKVKGYLITEGELVNGLSLGLFRDEQELAGLEERLSGLGYDLKSKIKTNSYDSYWVVLGAQAENRVSQQLALKILNDYPLIKQGEKVCKAVAS